MINSELYHHGIKGQKWGVRRYQNKDGSLTPAGKKQYKTDKLKRRDLETNASYARDIYSVYDSEYKRLSKNLIKKIKKNLTDEKDLNNIRALQDEVNMLRDYRDAAKLNNMQALSKLESHVNEMISKYGNKKVRDFSKITLSNGEKILKASLRTSTHPGEIYLEKNTKLTTDGSKITYYTPAERIYYFY